MTLVYFDHIPGSDIDFEKPIVWIELNDNLDLYSKH
jgi:hypothetical protein